MDVTEFMQGFVTRGQEEAYWRAFEKVFGSCAPVFKAVLLARTPGVGLGERDRVARGLREILRWQAEALETLAQREGPVGEPRPWAATLPTLGPHEHVVHFQPAERVGAETLRFIDVALRRDAKVLCLSPGAGWPGLSQAIVERGHGEAVRGGRIEHLPLDKHMARLAQGAPVEDPANAIAGAVEEGLEGYSEVWLAGHLAGRLYAGGHHGSNTQWEGALHRLTQRYPLTIYCPYPTPDAIDPEATLDTLRNHGMVVWGDGAYPLRPRVG